MSGAKNFPGVEGNLTQYNASVYDYADDTKMVVFLVTMVLLIFQLKLLGRFLPGLRQKRLGLKNKSNCCTPISLLYRKWYERPPSKVNRVEPTATVGSGTY